MENETGIAAIFMLVCLLSIIKFDFLCNDVALYVNMYAIAIIHSSSNINIITCTILRLSTVCFLLCIKSSVFVTGEGKRRDY